MTGTTATHVVESLPLAGLPSGRTVEATVHRYRGHRGGPTVYLQALQHGGEVNGAAVLRRIHDRLRSAPLAGEVVAVPVANPLAFDHRVYLAPTRLDAINSNMNRLWPGDPTGTLMERMVDRLWSLVSEADVVVDLHTGGPYMLSHTRFAPGDDESRRLAEAFGIDLLVAEGEAVDADAGVEPTGKLREVASGNGIPSITPELAHSREIVEDSVSRGVSGIENVLRSIGVLEGAVPDTDPTIGREKTHVYAGASGLFRSTDVTVGDVVDTGTPIGEVFDPTSYETCQTVTTERAGLLLSLNRGSTVMEGESVGSVVAVE